jgi:hypothetical protein
MDVVAIADAVSTMDRMILEALVIFFILSPDEEWEFLRCRKYALLERLKGDPQNGHNQHRDIWCTVIRHTPVRAAASAQQSANVNRYTEPHGRTVKLTLLPSRKNIFR